MLLWLQRGQAPKVKAFKLKIFLVSFFFHIILLFLGLFLSFNEPLKIEVRAVRYSVPLVFLPFQKKIPGAFNAIKSSSVPEFHTFSRAKIKIQNNGKAIKFKNQNIKKTTAVKKLEKLEITKPKIYINQKKDKKDKTKINEKIKKEKIAKEQEKIKKIEEKKIVQQKEEDKILKNEIEKRDTLQMLTKEKSYKIQESDIAQDEIYIGRQDLDQMEIEELIKREIESHWRPPEGLPKNLSCSAKAFIDNTGRALNIRIVKSSKSFAFDLSVKRDLAKAGFPKELYGKDIILNYGAQDK